MDFEEIAHDSEYYEAIVAKSERKYKSSLEELERKIERSIFR